MLFESEMRGPGPASAVAPPPRPVPAAPQPPRGARPPRPARPASLEVEPQPEAEPAPKREAKAAAKAAAKSAGKPGLLSRIAGSMSKDAPGSLWKRLLLLLLLLALTWGGYRVVKANWRRIAPRLGLGQQIIIPDVPPLPGQGPNPAEKLPPDWGPLITPAPSQAPGGQTGEPRG
jgi:hypothetical protein